MWQTRWSRWRERLWHVVGGVSIRTKILGIVLLMVVVPGSIVTLQVRNTLIAVFRQQLQEQGIAIARDVAARSTDLILVNDLYGLNRLLHDTQQHNRVVRYIFVTNPQGQVLAHTFGRGFPLDLLHANAVEPDAPYRVQPLDTEEGRVWDIAVPIFEGQVGTVRLGVSESWLWAVVTTVTGQIVFSLGVAFLLGIGAALVLTWILTRPILELVAATERVSRGDYSPRVRRWADDEIGALADAFNAMVERLAEAEAERKERERLRQTYLRQVIHAQEEERKRIARELHDELGQSLASLIVGLRNLEHASSPEVWREQVAKMRETVAHTLDRMRRLAFDLRPSLLDDLGLVAALRRYTQDFQARFGIPVEFEATGLEGVRLRPEVETAVYRIVQEALTNAGKYAGCDHISILVQLRDEDLSIIVEDDGCGFDVQKVMREKVGRTALGLYGMKERADLIGAQLDIESEPGLGTTVYLRVPRERAILEPPKDGTNADEADSRAHRG